MTRILVSGFEPFGGESLNPTALLVEALLARGSELIPPGAEVRAILLPVTFAGAFKRLEEEIKDFDPHAVLALGQAGGRNAIELERVAINIMDAELADHAGYKPCDVSIDPNGPAAFFSTLPLRRLEKALRVAGIPARISNTAGTYVCNDLFYRLQAAGLGRERLTGFVHVPWLPEQTVEKPGAPSMERQMQQNGLAILLQSIRDEISPYTSRP